MSVLLYMASRELSSVSVIVRASFSRMTGNSARGARMSKSSLGILPWTNGYPMYRSYCPLSLSSLLTSRMISLRCLYVLMASGLLAESHSLSDLFLPKRSPMTSTSVSVMRSKVFFLEILPWNSRRLPLPMLMSFFSSSLSVRAASSSMFDPFAAVMAYLRVMFRKSSP